MQQIKVTQDVQTSYDLGRNPTEIKLYDESGWVYTETRTYARGYQLTNFTEQHAAGVTVSMSGSYTYDTNNNMTGTKKLDAKRGAAQLAFREEWMFTYDRKDRLQSYTHSGMLGVETHLWWSASAE